MADPQPKPSIILPHGVGAHNADLAGAQRRLEQSGSYKNLSTIIITPTRGGRSLCPRFVSAVYGLMKPMNQAVIGPIFMAGMEVGAAYNAAVEMILGNPDLAKFKFLLTIEDDNIPPPDGLLKLYEGMKEYDAVGGLYWTKGEGGQPMIYGNPDEKPLSFRPQMPREGQLQACNGLGMGFTLFSLSVFKKLQKPWFVTKQDFDPQKGVSCYTQDLYAFENMAKLGMKIACNTAVRVGHLDPEADFVW